MNDNYYREYHRNYEKTEKRKAYVKEYRKRPEVHQKILEYKRKRYAEFTDEQKAKQLEYQRKCKAKNRAEVNARERARYQRKKELKQYVIDLEVKAKKEAEYLEFISNLKPYEFKGIKKKRKIISNG